MSFETQLRNPNGFGYTEVRCISLGLSGDHAIVRCTVARFQLFIAIAILSLLTSCSKSIFPQREPQLDGPSATPSPSPSPRPTPTPTPTTTPPNATYSLPSDRATSWVPGMIAAGGIPERTQVCSLIEASSYGNGSQEASAAIQSALDSCPDGQVVQLSPGQFLLNNHVLIRKSVTLRGSGAGVTILRKTNGAQARRSIRDPISPTTYSYDAQPLIIIGPNRWPKLNESSSRNLAAYGAQGARSVTVGDTSGFAAGQFVLLDERSGASWRPTPAGYANNAMVWASDRVAYPDHLPAEQWIDHAEFVDANGPYAIVNGIRTFPSYFTWFSRPDRPTCEIKEIQNVSGNTITFTTPLHIDYRVDHEAQVTLYQDAHVKNAGVESLSVMGGADGQIRFENAAYSWAKNIDSTQWIGEGFAVNASFRVEIRDSYIHETSWPQYGGGGYGISLALGSSEALVENNISIDVNKVMVVRSSGAGSVFGYNYTDDGWNMSDPGWQEVGINGSHMVGPHHILFEGNYSFNADSDYTWGNSIYLTFFRNWLTAQRRSFDSAPTSRAAGLAYGAWWMSFVGNVLGKPGQMTGFAYEDAAMAGGFTWGPADIWKLGYDPTHWNMTADPKVLSTVIRDGNFDYLTNSVRSHNASSSFVLPDSLYLTGKPAFFGNRPWPWVTPEGLSKTAVLPAKARFDAGTPNAI